MSVAITIADPTPVEEAVWAEAIALATLSPDWVLVGGLMVNLFALQHRILPVRATDDIDALFRLETVAASVSDFGTVLAGRGYTVTNTDLVNNRSYRLTRDTPRTVVDVLIPRRKRAPRARVTIVGSGTHPVAVAGGSEALRHVEQVVVTCGATSGPLRRPSLTGALLMKSKAAVVDSIAQRHREDLAVLYACVDDPATIAAAIGTTDRATLGAATPDWAGVDQEFRADAQLAHRGITGT